MDASPSTVSGGAYTSSPASLNYNNGKNYEEGRNAAMAISPDEALGRLKQGNAIFARGGANISLPSMTRVAELSKGQKPFAVIIGCSDSRAAPELIFDCNLGELFVVRVAGSTVSREGLGSIVYAVEHLGAPLVVVLGHTKCGAVGAAVDVATKHAELHGALHEMVLPILPAVLEAEEKHPADLQDAAIRQNVRGIAHRLKVADGMLAERIEEGPAEDRFGLLRSGYGRGGLRRLTSKARRLAGHRFRHHPLVIGEVGDADVEIGDQTVV